MRLGVYEVIALLGQGGMGEVYRARDTRLNRDVALKVLPAAVAGDAERLARFRREAQVLAALNHPHIAQIHGLEEGEHHIALVMELVEGPTLADVVAGASHAEPRVDAALAIARQIAEALDAAHLAGIVHRDLKPANIKVRNDGTVKVLDFGLAKAIDRAGGNIADSPTITTPAMTQAGVIMGTAAYMSPEQARGKTVDKHTDIWAFGCVLYELLTGRRAFEGETVTDVLSAVVRAEPDWTRIPAATPASVKTLLQRCLQKDPAKRLRDIGDAGGDLRDESAVSAAAVATRSPKGRLGWIVVVASGVFAGAAVALIPALGERKPATALAAQFSLTIPEAVDLATPDRRGAAPFPAVSPDGRHLAFVGVGRDGVRKIWVRALDTLTARVIEGTDEGVRPFWSPDSAALGFFADGQIKSATLDGGQIDVVCTMPGAGNATGASWSRQGIILFGVGLQLFQVAAVGGQATLVSISLEGPRFPWFLPDGRRFLVVNDARTVWLASLDAPGTTELLRADSNALYAGGFLLFSRNGALVAQAFDDDAGRVTGSAVPLAPLSVTDVLGDVALTVSDTGALVFRDQRPERTELVWRDRTGQPLGKLGPSDETLLNPALSPDASRAAVAIRTADQSYDIWLIDVRRGTSSRFTSARGSEFLPQWSPDGQFVAYTGGANGSENFYRKRASGAGDEQLLRSTRTVNLLNQWSPDGQFLWWPDITGLTCAPVDRIDKQVTYLKRGFDEAQPSQSPDGKWVAFRSNESGRPEIYIRPFPNASAGKYQVTYDGGFNEAIGLSSDRSAPAAGARACAQRHV